MANLSHFFDQTFYVTIIDADIGRLKSLHTLFDKYLEYMMVKFKQNHMVRNIQNFELFGEKMVAKVLTPFWNRLLYQKQLFDAQIYLKTIIFQRSKIYGDLTPVLGLNLHQTWQSRSALTKRASTFI